MSYAQIGLLLGVPNLIGNLIEPFLAILGDVWRRRAIVLGGGILFAAALLLTALSHTFAPLLLSFILFYPASGAFVSLSQATLMDLEPARHEQNMARWTFAGSLGVVAGPLALGGAAMLGWGWRGIFVGFAALAVSLLALVWRMPIRNGRGEPAEEQKLDIKAIASGLAPRSGRCGAARCCTGWCCSSSPT